MAFKPIEILINAKDNASGVFDSLKAKIMVVGAFILSYFGINAFAGMVKGSGDLEQALDRVQAATGATKDEMILLRKAAEDSGVDSIAAAGALENLAKAGLSANDAIGALPAVISLAKAGDIEMAESAEFLTKAVMGMGLAFSDAGRVADVLALGANATNTSVKGLAEGLSYAAPVAQSLGLSLETTVAIIGKFADAGIDASRAGTALNSILSQFSDPASRFRGELAAAGITTGNFEEALHQLAAAGPRGSRAINAVGQEAGPALRALLNQGMPALDALTGKLKNAAGSAEATAEVMRSNLNGSLGGLSIAWDAVKNKLATPVLPVLKSAVDQLSGAFKSAVSDGTIQKFGDSIAVGFQSGIKWARDFLTQINFTKLSADLRAFADRSSEMFTQVGEYASTAGNTVRLVYGVMSAGVNAVLTAVYGLGSGFAEVASKLMAGVVLLREGLATVTFGGLSESFKLAAEDARNTSQGFGEAAQAMRDKAAEALQQVAAGAQLARDGFSGMAEGATSATPAVNASAQAIGGMAKQLEAAAEKNATARKATEDKKAADEAATTSVRQLNTEYAALVAGGNLQAATEKLQEINKALHGTPAAAADATKAADAAAKALNEAFQALGITSSAELNQLAINARTSYETIKNSGSSTAADISNAFKVMAEKAIAANNGIAPSWVAAEAGARGLEVQVDKTGKSVISAMGGAGQTVDQLGDQFRMTTEQIQASEDAVARLLTKYTQSVNYSERQISLLEKENALVEHRNALERERLSIDKEGFSTDKDGKRLVAGTDLGTLTGIAAFLKSAGVNDDKAARRLALEFSDGQGNIDYIGNAGQKKYGGDTLSMALLRAAETYTFGPGKNGSNAQEPSTIPKPDSNVPLNSYITNITLDGNQRTVRVADADSAAALNDILRQLADARGTAS